MKGVALLLSAFAFALASCGGGGGSSSSARLQAEQQSIMLERAFPALSFAQPVAMLQAPGDDSRWFVLEKGGSVLVFSNDDAVQAASVFIDISDRAEAGPSEAGLLGMAIHPQFTLNGEVFLSYTAAGPGGGTPLISHISRFRSNGGGSQLDPASEEILLSVDQPFTNHNGGNLAFGPDGFLYIGLGDGGSGGDPQGNGQNTDTLMGAILRIDVDTGSPYGIPADNPFVLGGGRPEIFAWGLRNPWRWSFDRLTGDLWAGDVGQSQLEEVDRIVPGGNYGWNRFEGSLCFSGDCNPAGLIPPVAEYTHGEGCSITGGFVYRGSDIPSLAGTYLYGDFCTGTLWGLDSSSDGTLPSRVLLESTLSISSFAEGNDGEFFVLDYTGGTLHRLVSP
jgi:glucose/arabinose dehydrogenase